MLAVNAALVVAAAQRIENLTIAVDGHTTIGKALGIIMVQFDLDDELAFAVLRRLSRDGNPQAVRHRSEFRRDPWSVPLCTAAAGALAPAGTAPVRPIRPLRAPGDQSVGRGHNATRGVRQSKTVTLLFALRASVIVSPGRLSGTPGAVDQPLWVNMLDGRAQHD
nr:ANTAR domain-containing protein [Ornithinimicrobium sediminis]